MSSVLVVLGLFLEEEIKHPAANPAWYSWVAGRTRKQSVALSRGLPSVET
jgi:uncharacterized ferritin-like protein (DUF455 family)